MIGILLLLSIALVVGSTYGYLLPYIEAERALQHEQRAVAIQKAVVTDVIVEWIDENQNYLDGDPPTVVAIPKNKTI
jgi:hypothetical protein